MTLISITVVDRKGSEHAIAARPGTSLMETLRENGIDELLALCGGCCSCATCHLFIDPAFRSLVGDPGEDEADLLDCSRHRTAHSRLSCQIALSAAHDGLRVTIATED